MLDQSQNRRGPGSGFTLLELLLVLSLLVIVASMATPMIGPMLDNNRLRQGAELVHARLARARVHAIQRGRTYLFLYEPAGSKFVIQALPSIDDYLESDQIGIVSPTLGAGGVTAMAPPVTAQNTAEIDLPRVETLPEQIIFGGGDADFDPRGEMLQQMALANGLTVGDPSVAWGAPIFFYPDGSSSTARVLLVNPEQRQVLVTLRGLTGIIKVSTMQQGGLP